MRRKKSLFKSFKFKKVTKLFPNTCSFYNKFISKKLSIKYAPWMKSRSKKRMKKIKIFKKKRFKFYKKKISLKKKNFFKKKKFVYKIRFKSKKKNFKYFLLRTPKKFYFLEKKSKITYKFQFHHFLRKFFNYKKFYNLKKKTLTFQQLLHLKKKQLKVRLMEKVLQEQEVKRIEKLKQTEKEKIRGTILSWAGTDYRKMYSYAVEYYFVKCFSPLPIDKFRYNNFLKRFKKNFLKNKKKLYSKNLDYLKKKFYLILKHLYYFSKIYIIKKFFIMHASLITGNFPKINVCMFIRSYFNFRINAELIGDFLVLWFLKKKFVIKEILGTLLNFLKKSFVNKIIGGYAILMRGRFTRKDRAMYSWKKIGAMPLSHRVATIDYCNRWVPLKYSQCAFKVYILKLDAHYTRKKHRNVRKKNEYKKKYYVNQPQ